MKALPRFAPRAPQGENGIQKMPSAVSRLETFEALVKRLVNAINERRDWFVCTSRWSALEVVRTLRRDGKPRELIELNLKELKRQRVSFMYVTRAILSDAEKLLISHDLYTSDALHMATFAAARRRLQLDGMLTDDRTYA